MGRPDKRIETRRVKEAMLLPIFLSLSILACNIPQLNDELVEPNDADSTAVSGLSEDVDSTGRDLAAIESVQTWLYLIDVNLESDTVEQIVDSDYDMVVIDFIRSEENRIPN